MLKAELASLKAGRVRPRACSHPRVLTLPVCDAQKTYEKQCGLYFLTDRQAIDVAGKAAVVEQQKRQLGSKEQKS